jgi:hypothetical protein
MLTPVGVTVFDRRFEDAPSLVAVSGIACAFSDAW